jgi:RNA polymerase sigma-70 factor (ECF subfamily)
MLIRSRRCQRARIAEGFDLEELALLPADDENWQGQSDVLLGNCERAACVRAAVAALPPKYRDVVVAHYVDDLELQGIARRLGLTEGAVRVRLHRARARLRKSLARTMAREAALLVKSKAAHTVAEAA